MIRIFKYVVWTTPRSMKLRSMKLLHSDCPASFL
jgi:hypothetical protein